MQVNTRAYGWIEVDDRQKIAMPEGLYGFEFLHDFAIIDARKRPFFWLQSLEDEERAFVLIDPRIIRSDYDPEISQHDVEALGFDGPDDERMLQFVIVTVPEDENQMTANLQGPLIVNKENHLGRQCISGNSLWTVRHNVIQEISESRSN